MASDGAAGWERATSDWTAAIAGATELGMRPLIARSRLGLGRLERQMGRTSQARENLTAAVTMLREMGMRHWLEQAEAELGRL